MDDCDEWAKRYKLSYDRKTSHEFHSNAKKEAVDFYKAEMDKLFAGKAFLNESKFEDHHRENRCTAWEIYKSHGIPDGYEFAFKRNSRRFHAHVEARYWSYKQTNEENRESSRKTKGLRFFF